MSFNQESQLLLLEINLIEGVKLHGLKAALTFVNFRKTFAASAMVECLAFWVYCVPNRIVHTKDLVHDGTRSRVLKLDGNTDYLLVFYKTTCSYKLWKTKACNNCMSCHEIQRLQMCEKSHNTHQESMWWHVMIIPFRTP